MKFNPSNRTTLTLPETVELISIQKVNNRWQIMYKCQDEICCSINEQDSQQVDIWHKQINDFIIYLNRQIKLLTSIGDNDDTINKDVFEAMVIAFQFCKDYWENS